jgi:hypothetical protein
VASSAEKSLSFDRSSFVWRVTLLSVFGKPSKRDRTEASERQKDLRPERFDSALVIPIAHVLKLASIGRLLAACRKGDWVLLLPSNNC